MEMSANNIEGKRIILGISGGIAAYKTAEVIRLYKKGGADVRVVMTHSASKFVAPLTLGTLAESEVLTEIFPENEDGSWTKHVNLGLWADIFVIAPATAHTIATLASGHCDSMLAAVALSARCPLLVCPSMDHDMFIHPATQSNLEKLRSYGYNILAPDHGELASGLVGQGRLPEPEDIYRQTELVLSRTDQERSDAYLKGKRVLVTAGPTVEAIDPVRFISNRSTGRMGYAIAKVALELGAAVDLITGPTSLTPPAGASVVKVESAGEMFDAVQTLGDADIIVMAAAVADFTPERYSDSKIKKKDDSDPLSLALARTKDILAESGKQKRPGQVLVGFALETNDGVQNARLKLEKKNLDLIVLNNPNDHGAGFGTTTNDVTLLARDGDSVELPLMSKEDVARKIFEHVRELVAA